MTIAKPVYLPMDPNVHNTQQGHLMFEPDKYRRLVGTLLCLTLTTPDVTYTVRVLSQFMKTPTQAHFQAALKVLRYLKQSPG